MWNLGSEAPPDFLAALYGDSGDDEDWEDEYLDVDLESDEEVLICFSQLYRYVLKKLRCRY